MRRILGQRSVSSLVCDLWLQFSFTGEEFAPGKNADFIPQGRKKTGINQHLKPFADTCCSQLSQRRPGVNMPEADSSLNVCIVRIPLHSDNSNIKNTDQSSRRFKSIKSKKRFQ